MPPKRDRRHDNPGRPKLKASEKTAAVEVKTRVSIATDKGLRAATDAAGVGVNKWLRTALEVLLEDRELLERVKARATAETES